MIGVLATLTGACGSKSTSSVDTTPPRDDSNSDDNGNDPPTDDDDMMARDDDTGDGPADSPMDDAAVDSPADDSPADDDASPDDTSTGEPPPYHDDPVVQALKSDVGFFDVHGTSTDNVWAVGETVMHWNGDAWTENAPPVDGKWRHVAAAPDGRVWIAEGYVGVVDNPQAPLLYHWTGSEWEPWALPEQTPGGTWIVDAYQPMSLGLDAEGRLWVGLEFAADISGEFLAPPIGIFLDELGEWHQQGNPPIVIGNDGYAYYSSSISVFRGPGSVHLGRCEMAFTRDARPAIAVDDGRLVAMAPAQDDQRRSTGDIRVCEVEFDESQSLPQGEEYLLPPSTVGRLAAQGRDVDPGQISPHTLTGFELVALNGAMYLAGADSFRQAEPSAEWEPLNWDFPLRAGWGMSDQDAWFAGSEGIAHWDGQELIVSSR